MQGKSRIRPELAVFTPRGSAIRHATAQRDLQFAAQLRQPFRPVRTDRPFDQGIHLFPDSMDGIQLVLTGGCQFHHVGSSVVRVFCARYQARRGKARDHATHASGRYVEFSSEFRLRGGAEAAERIEYACLARENAVGRQSLPQDILQKIGRVQQQMEPELGMLHDCYR